MDNNILENQIPANDNWTKKLPKVIFIILGLVVLGEVIWGVSVLLKGFNQPKTTSNALQPSNPAITLSAADQKYKVGETIPVIIKVDTGQSYTDGTDVVLKFDPNVLTASPSSFVKGTIYNEYPQTAIDNKSGTIQISGITSIPEGFKGQGSFGTLLFTAKKIGQTQVKIIFTPGKTTDSNIAETKSAKNILQETNSVNINISK